MSAGKGIYHSEYNKNKDKKVNFLQIWVFPKVKNIEPRYEQKTYNPEDRVNKLQQVVSAVKGEEGVWINQDAWFHLGNLKNGFETEYALKQKGNGVYAFVIGGDVTINGQSLNKRDGLGVWDTDKLTIKADSDAFSMGTMIPIGGIGYISPCIANDSMFYAGQVPDQFFHTPETTTGQNCIFYFH